MRYEIILCCFLASFGTFAQSTTDSTAEKMLLYQRSYGGWPQYHGDATNYDLAIDDARKEMLLADKNQGDATIDDKSTTLEIEYLINSFSKTQNKTYLNAACKGIDYLLKAQNKAGGWPQWYPDTKGYHTHITYNDQAMIDVMNIMKMAAYKTGAFASLPKQYATKAKAAMENGIKCILSTQYKQNGKLTAWCAQHDVQTLEPAKARMFELPSLSGNESVGIVRFLMQIDHPSEEIKTAIEAAVSWLDQVKIPDADVKFVDDPNGSKRKDRVLISAPGHTLWARFYDLETNRPIFVGRDSQVKYAIAEIEFERRSGYAYYGTWPYNLINKEYPAWVAKWGK